MIRFFDVFFSAVLLLVSLPVLLIIGFFVLLDDGFPIFYVQKRIGRHGREFSLYKFRSMRKDANKKGNLTVGDRDPRILKSGYFIRKYKLDELPQLINVLNGSMSVVGPRPEVKEFVDMYTDHQRKVLKVRPGITDLASIKYRNENEVLAKAENSRKVYIEEIMPEKIELNLEYIQNKSLTKYFSIIFGTFSVIIRGEGQQGKL